MVKLPEAPGGVSPDQWMRAVAVAAAAEAAPRNDFVRTVEAQVLRLSQSFEHYIVTGEAPS